MGRVLTVKGRYEEAEREFQRALEIDPVNAEAFRRFARTYEDMRRRQDAEQTYEKAIRLRPIDWRGYKQLGDYYFRNGNYAEAARSYQRVADLTPGNYNAHNDLGAVYLRMGNYPNAAAQLEKSVALKPTPKNCSNLGSLYYFQGRYKDAARWYEKAVSEVSTDSSYWGNLADAYRWTPELSSKAPEAYGKAVLFGQKELTGNARNSRLRSRVAYYYAALGDKDSASREIAQALRLSPDDGYVLFRAAVVYEQFHNRDAALDAIQAALRTGYSAEEIRKEPILENLRTEGRYKALFDSKLSK
jgi:tetratricopeptide (TPR) repeat protein